MVLSFADLDYYAEVISMEDNTLRLKRMQGVNREYFRVDDVFPVIAKKVTGTLLNRKSKIFLGYVSGIYEVGAHDETINPQLWKLLVDMNNKLGLILERLYLESEGFLKAEDKQVNISASGIRFAMEENVDAGDIVEVKMLLPTYPPVGILTYGKVVRVENRGNGLHEVALHFSDMDDDVRDEIIQYSIQRQREFIRKQKQQKEKGES